MVLRCRPVSKSHFDILDRELWMAGMRLNQAEPQVFIIRTKREVA